MEPGTGPGARERRPAGRARRFDGGYAQVIRPSVPGPPSAGPGRAPAPASAGPSRPADHDVYVYRDVSDPAPASPARHAAADDAAYWYDLLAEDPVPRQEETRGPFEPLLPSGETSSAADQAAPTEQAQSRRMRPATESPEAPERARARKLEQLKDLYLTAEAIGEQNVDKHFDQLLAQQRELISDYFRQSAAAKPGASPDLAAGPHDDPSAAAAGAAPPGQATSAGRRGRPRRATARMVNRDERTPVIAVLGLGEAGSVIARDLLAAGAESAAMTRPSPRARASPTPAARPRRREAQTWC